MPRVSRDGKAQETPIAGRYKKQLGVDKTVSKKIRTPLLTSPRRQVAVLLGRSSYRGMAQKLADLRLSAVRRRRGSTLERAVLSRSDALIGHAKIAVGGILFLVGRGVMTRGVRQVRVLPFFVRPCVSSFDVDGASIPSPLAIYGKNGRIYAAIMKHSRNRNVLSA